MPANAPKWAYMRFFTLAYTLPLEKVIYTATSAYPQNRVLYKTNNLWITPRILNAFNILWITQAFHAYLYRVPGLTPRPWET